MQHLLRGVALALALLAGTQAWADSTPGNLGTLTTSLTGSQFFDQGPGTDTKLGYNTNVFCVGAGNLTLCSGGVTAAMLATGAAVGNIGYTPPGAFTLATGLAKTAGTRNTGTDQITTTGQTIFPQFFPVTKAANYTVNADNGGTSDAGVLLIATGANPTFTLPNPAAGTKGNCYNFGSDGAATHGYTLTTVGGVATLYSFGGGGGTSQTLPVGISSTACDDGTNYFLAPAASPVYAASLTWFPGINPNNAPVLNIKFGAFLIAVRCTPEVLAGGAATIQPVKAASGTAISAGTSLTSTTCNANSGAGTDQDLTITGAQQSLAAGTRLGITTTGTTIWTSSGVAQGIITFYLIGS